MKNTFYFITWKGADGTEYVCTKDGLAYFSSLDVSKCLFLSKPVGPKKKSVFNLYMLEVENDEVANICPCNW